MMGKHGNPIAEKYMRIFDPNCGKCKGVGIILTRKTIQNGAQKTLVGSALKPCDCSTLALVRQLPLHDPPSPDDV